MKPHILDSSAWLECLEDGPNSKHFAPVLRKLPDIIIPSVVITEVRKVALRQRTIQQAEEVTRAMQSGIVVPIDEQIAVTAANLSLKHKLPLADSLIYATALFQAATLWTQDADFEGLPHVKYFPKIKP